MARRPRREREGVSVHEAERKPSKELAGHLVLVQTLASRLLSIIKMRGPIDVLFAFKIFSLPVPTRPGTRTFWQVPDPSRPEVKNPYPSDPANRLDIFK